MLQRPRRNRKSEAIRGLTIETKLHVNHLVQPLFLVDGQKKKNAIKSLTNIHQLSIDNALKEIEACMQVGVNSFILFPAVEDALKNKTATYSYSSKNFYLKAIKEIKKKFPESCLISDVAMDPYSSDGHDGYVENGKIVPVITVQPVPGADPDETPGVLHHALNGVLGKPLDPDDIFGGDPVEAKGGRLCMERPCGKQQHQQDRQQADKDSHLDF